MKELKTRVCFAVSFTSLWNRGQCQTWSQFSPVSPELFVGLWRMNFYCTTCTVGHSSTEPTCSNPCLSGPLPPSGTCVDSSSWWSISSSGHRLLPWISWWRLGYPAVFHTSIFTRKCGSMLNFCIFNSSCFQHHHHRCHRHRHRRRRRRRRRRRHRCRRRRRYRHHHHYHYLFLKVNSFHAQLYGYTFAPKWSLSTYPWTLPLQAANRVVSCQCHHLHTLLKSSCPCPHISLQPPLHFYRPTPNNPHTYIRSRCSNRLNLPLITTRSRVQYSFLRRSLYCPHGAHPCRCHKLINPSRMGWFNVAPFQADINSVTHICMPYHKSLPIIIWFISIANSIFKIHIILNPRIL